ncbi:SDR family oxidoreductase [Marinilongibacter aquaticus]|uniref:SDR family oxidoreductase n=1 Tax=Marinilongibacter aquaticus TaxID=2975157 RepID=UPI0021BDCA42|nr:SDR family oxidoreductase [Marinilongibacter aquaticus]UBM58779.1 SDR family oxidoreductase [Marinilongibacter aquaticus]
MQKTVLITGASSGFGKETAKLFQKKGWKVIASMRSPEKESELNQLENVLVVGLDVQDTNSIKAAVEAGVDKFGTIDVLVNNAGYGLMGVFESATREQIQNQFEVNVFGMMQTTQAALPYLRKNGKGTIVNISTFGGITAMPFTTLYSASKFAVEGFSEALSHELFKFNIGVKIVEPGGVHTNFRTGLDIIKNDIEEYNPLMTNFFSRYTQPTEDLPKATPENVAETIYKAATDETAKLRYVIGEDAQFYVDMKFKNSEEKMVQSVRDFFIN